MVFLRDLEALDNGARFHNVDLHIHSYTPLTTLKMWR